MSITTPGWYLLAGLSGEDISSSIYSNYDVNGVELNSAYVALGRDLSSVFNDYPVTSYSSVDLSSITLFPTNFNENQNANDISFIGTDVSVSDISNMSIFKMNNFSILDLSSQAKFPFNMGVWCLFKELQVSEFYGITIDRSTNIVSLKGPYEIDFSGISSGQLVINLTSDSSGWITNTFGTGTSVTSDITSEFLANNMSIINSSFSGYSFTIAPKADAYLNNDCQLFTFGESILGLSESYITSLTFKGVIFTIGSGLRLL